jgi:glycosyltransferase involved in cell wall biosynthesis
MNSHLSDVTFVISTYKRHVALDVCLASIRDMYPLSKVVIVNDDPSDGNLVFNDSNVQYLKNLKNVGCPKSRNIGASFVDTPFIFFLDDDATIGNVDIATARDLLTENSSIVVCGFPARNHIGDAIYLTGFFDMTSDSKEPFFDTPAFNGGACLVRTSFFLPRGYHPRIQGYGEEAELTLRAISSDLRVVALKNGGAIDHFPTLAARDVNLARQRKNDVVTAFEYGGLFLGHRQFAAHSVASIRMRSLHQLLGCFLGLLSGVNVINFSNRKRRVAYRSWLRLSRISVIS